MEFCQQQKNGLGSVIVVIIAKENERKEIFKKNLQLLTPWLREIILQIDEEELWKRIEINYNDEGHPICIYHEENKSFKINSERPLIEAETWCKAINMKGSGAVFLYGSGFGYSLFEVFSKKQPHTIVVLFEQNIYIFAAMLYYFDLEPIINTQKIAFLIGDIHQFSKVLNILFSSIIFANCTSPTIAFSLVAQRNFKEKYIEIHKHVFSQLGLFVFYIGNDHLDNLIGLHNLLYNMKEIILNPYISDLKDKFKDVPAFIVANGPSLDKNIHQLKKVQNKGLIISTESAIIPLIKNRIKPDILTIIERTKYTYTYHFENIKYPEDISLICLGIVDKNVFPSFNGAKIPVFRSQEAINQWINRYVGDGSAINAGANVSHLALEIAIYLGANPIVFVGQDYAYGSDGKTHSKDAVYSHEKGKRAREILKSKPIVCVEGNEGGMIPSNQLWVDFKRGLEMKIASYPEKVFINATEGGAKIKGSIYSKLDQVIEKYCVQKVPYGVHELIKDGKDKISILERKEGFKKFIKSVEEYSSIFRKLSREAVSRQMKCKDMLRLSQEKDIDNNYGVLEKTFKEHIDSYQLFIEDDLVRCFCQQVIFVYFYLLNSIGVIDSPDKIAKVFEIQHSFFYHLNVVCQSLSVYLEDAIEVLESLLVDLESI